MRNIFSILLIISIPMLCLAQEKELLIIGTMHTIPKIVKNSYKPLLDYAIEYAPEAIYVEDIQPSDTLSLQTHTPIFLKQSDSLRIYCQIDENHFINLLKNDLTDLTENDLNFLSQTYLLKRDRANYSYYKYLSLYGIKGAKEPLRNENEDLTFKLAAQMGIKELFPIDDHQSDQDYYKAWDKAIRESKKNGDIKLLNKLIKKNKKRLVVASLLGQLGKCTNNPKTLYLYYLINSFRFAQHSNPHTEAVKDFWDIRNYRMAKNIVKQIMATPYKRNVLIVGAGHIISLSKALNEINPNLKIILMYK